MQVEQPADRIVNRGLPGRVGGRPFDMPCGPGYRFATAKDYLTIVTEPVA